MAEPIREHEDYRTPISERHKIANELALWLDEQGMFDASALSHPVERAESGRCYRIWFQAQDALGTVRIYSPAYFVVAYTCAHPDSPFPTDGETRLYASLLEVQAFLKLAFVDLDWSEALQVPTRPPTIRKSKRGGPAGA